MAQFFKAKPNRSKQLSPKLTLDVEQLDHLGAGIAQHQGKVVFVPGALPGERARVQLTEQKKNYARARLLAIETPTPARTVPPCPHYQACGGCDLQHMALAAQREHKQAALTSVMAKFAGASSDLLATPLEGEGWHYRRRARLATWYDKPSKTLTLGFRAASSSQVVAISQCLVLAEPLSALIAPFSLLLNRLAGRSTLGHLELIQADNGLFAVLRITKALKDQDKQQLSEFAGQQGIHLLLQDNDGQFEYLSAGRPMPHYALLDGGVCLSFTPGNFVQVNEEINRRMVEQALDWLAPEPGERILDLFCGVGNFSAPLAAKGAEVVGVEGVPEMVTQARSNAAANELANLTFFHGDLSADLSGEAWMGKIDKLLLDPARAGAFESLQWLKKMKPRSVVYVSCNPASLARDTGVLLAQGYKLQKLGLIDMFPQTHHIEAMALFELTR
ncbi:23S rRNA (uracil(1939)-C(5))-methyltransferase RlmD [Shewanella salipaludis]|uniref:23S rRNA (uracil(1939)-C(5))-methyltransferase RlmD n=1 Tax=Shewanella salipaludis TaxID=2723052 RepID=A0A972FZX2_9GAMM|nr:23S rRNA (uracil(1939)-C(5))-methyltransferase RlmD [Shewanella salipaludis]NMH65777.1 23S rRNA (uracil(1939)-C(5))-methyltransferase RlmD [Shewanella salipaludis]